MADNRHHSSLPSDARNDTDGINYDPFNMIFTLDQVKELSRKRQRPPSIGKNNFFFYSSVANCF